MAQNALGALNMSGLLIISLILAGCLADFRSGDDTGAEAGLEAPASFDSDGVDPRSWAVDSDDWDPDNPASLRQARAGVQGDSGPLHREDSITIPVSDGGPRADPNHANAWGVAEAIKVRSDLLLEVEVKIGELEVVQRGPGNTSDERRLVTVSVPDPRPGNDHIVRAELGVLAGTSVVDPDRMESWQTMSAELLNVSVLDGTVTADVVRAEAFTRATPEDAEWSTNGTVIVGLDVQGERLVSVDPWFQVDLSDVFGPGSYVSLVETWGHIHVPRMPIDGFAADLNVAMIRVVLADGNPLTPIDERVEITISQVHSHSDFPSPFDGDMPGVHGHAYNLHVSHALPGQPITLGLVNLPRLGGDEAQHTADVDVNGNAVALAKSRAWGEVLRGESWARSQAEATDVCLVPALAGCAVEAEVVRVESHAEVGPDGLLATDAKTLILGLKAMGQDICPTLNLDGWCEPEPNTVIEVPLVGTIILNRQLDVDISADHEHCHTAVLVRGLVLESVLDVRVIVSEAESGAFFCPDQDHPLHG